VLPLRFSDKKIAAYRNSPELACIETGEILQIRKRCAPFLITGDLLCQQMLNHGSALAWLSSSIIRLHDSSCLGIRAPNICSINRPPPLPLWS
jgi:hypothetical protein